MGSLRALADRDFVKMNGLGNEILVVDLRAAPVPLTAAAARAAARQEPYDQLMALYPAQNGADAFVRIFNNDGSEAAACGNGMRCVAALEAAASDKAVLAFETAAGSLLCWPAGEGEFTVDMGPPRLRWDQIPLAVACADTTRLALTFAVAGAPALQAPSAVNMGNPHAVFFVDDPMAYDLAAIGPQLEHHPMFPERANITLAAVRARDLVVIRTFERGAGLTRACGSAACAAAVAAARRDLGARQARVSLPGGMLSIDWRAGDDHVLMTGPVEYERRGVFDAGLIAAAGAP